MYPKVFAIPLKRLEQLGRLMEVVSADEKTITLLKQSISCKDEVIKNYFDGGNDNYNNFLLICRRFNSSTPVIPHEEINFNGSKGGGYILSWHNKIIAIDPGYNFIENIRPFGLRPSNLDGIILTHAHPDHTGDLENILTLLYEYNDVNKDEKKIDVFMNLTSAVKFINLIKFHGAVGNFQILNVDKMIRLDEYNMEVIPIKAKHDEFGSKMHVLGLYFNLYNNIGSDSNPFYKIGFTSDTGWYEGLSEHFTGVDVLIAHIGGIKKHEIIPEIHTEEYYRKYCICYDDEKNNCMGNYYYKNHLGLWGCYHLLYDVNPKLAIISEFGEELIISHPDENLEITGGDKFNNVISDNRLSIAKLLEKSLHLDKKQTRVISADVGLKIELEENLPKIQCTYCEKTIIPEEIECISKPTYSGIPEIHYRCIKCKNKP